jgi:hypothetical protein
LPPCPCRIGWQVLVAKTMNWLIAILPIWGVGTCIWSAIVRHSSKVERTLFSRMYFWLVLQVALPAIFILITEGRPPKGSLEEAIVDFYMAIALINVLGWDSLRWSNSEAGQRFQLFQLYICILIMLTVAVLLALGQSRLLLSLYSDFRLCFPIWLIFNGVMAWKGKA